MENEQNKSGNFVLKIAPVEKVNNEKDPVGLRCTMLSFPHMHSASMVG